MMHLCNGCSRRLRHSWSHNLSNRFTLKKRKYMRLILRRILTNSNENQANNRTSTLVYRISCKIYLGKIILLSWELKTLEANSKHMQISPFWRIGLFLKSSSPRNIQLQNDFLWSDLLTNGIRLIRFLLVRARSKSEPFLDSVPWRTFTKCLYKP